MLEKLRPWHFPLLLLAGSLLLLATTLSSCGAASSPTVQSCLPLKSCPGGDTQNVDDQQGTTQAGTITETPVSKTALKAYLILSSSDSQDSGRIVPDGAQLSIQLTPQGRGMHGKTLLFKRTVSAKDIGLGNIPPGTYTMHIKGIDQGGKPLQVCVSYNDNEPAPTQLLALQHGLLGVEGQSATTVQLMLCPS